MQHGLCRIQAGTEIASCCSSRNYACGAARLARASGMPTPTLTTARALSISSIARNAIARRTVSASGARLAHGAFSAPDSVPSIAGLAKLCQCRSGGATTTWVKPYCVKPYDPISQDPRTPPPRTLQRVSKQRCR